MGFHRQQQPDPPPIGIAIADAVEKHMQQLIAEAFAAADPFQITHDCLNPAGHDFIASCGDVVCCHCAKVVAS